MFIINLLLSLALSMLAVIAGLAGWALTSLATRSVLKKKVLKNPKILDSHSQILLKNGCGAPTNPYSGKADETTCSVNNQNGIYCNQDCKIDGVSYYSATGKCVETNCNDNLDNDNDGLTDCLDPDCCGKTGPDDRPCCTPPAGKTADQCCAEANSRYACDTTAHQCYRTCSSNEQCQQGYCCTDDPKGPGNRKFECVDRGIYSENNQYLCDPPGWEAEEKQDLSRIPLLFLSSFNPFS